MFCARRAAGPVIGVRPGDGKRETGDAVSAAIRGCVSRFSCPVSRRASSGLLGMTGRSATLPLSNRLRHSSPTESGSRRYCSYITCTNAALWVPKTNSLTEENLTNRTSDVRHQYILRSMFGLRFAWLGLLPLASAEAQSLGLLRDELAGRIARAPATTVGLHYHNLTRPDSIL